MPTIAKDTSYGYSSGAANHLTTGANINTSAITEFVTVVVCWLDTGSKVPTGVADTATLTYYPRGPVKSYADQAGTNYRMQEWGAYAAAQLVNDNITVTFSGATSGDIAVVIFTTSLTQYNGSNIAASYDTQGGLPTAAPLDIATAATTSFITTHLAPDFVFSVIMAAPDNAITKGATWTQLQAGFASTNTQFYVNSEYLVETSPELDLSANWTWVVNTTYKGLMFCDALTATGSSPNDITETYLGAAQNPSEPVVSAVWGGS